MCLDVGGRMASGSGAGEGRRMDSASLHEGDVSGGAPSLQGCSELSPPQASSTVLMYFAGDEKGNKNTLNIAGT